MWQTKQTGKATKSGNPRKHARGQERFITDGLTTDLGRVLDLSASGVRINCQGPLPFIVGQIVPLVIRSADKQVTVNSKVVRIKWTDVQQAEVGFSFADPAPEFMANLRALVGLRR